VLGFLVRYLLRPGVPDQGESLGGHIV